MAAGWTGLLSPQPNERLTHDFVITVTVARLLGESLEREDWPGYLESAFFQQAGGCISTAYRDRFKRQPGC